MTASTRAAAMTDARKPRRGPHPGWTLGGAAALFATILTLLVWQVRTGHDPALGAPRAAAVVAQAPPQRVLVKRIVRRVIDEKVVEQEADDGGPVVAASPVAASGPIVSSYTAAPPPAPAPAPAPAPIVTRSS